MMRIASLGRQAAHDRLQLAPRGLVGIAVELHAGAADVLDQVEHRLALLGAHRVAQDAAQQPDVVAQRDVLLGRLAIVGVRSVVHAASCCFSRTLARGLRLSRPPTHGTVRNHKLSGGNRHAVL